VGGERTKNVREVDGPKLLPGRCRLKDSSGVEVCFSDQLKGRGKAACLAGLQGNYIMAASETKEGAARANGE